MFWRLDGHTPVPVGDDVLEWARTREGRDDRMVGHTELPNGLLVSTIFLGLDHNYLETGPAILFETMIFKGDEVFGACGRCATWEEAEAMHRDAVDRATCRPPL